MVHCPGQNLQTSLVMGSCLLRICRNCLMTLILIIQSRCDIISTTFCLFWFVCFPVCLIVCLVAWLVVCMVVCPFIGFWLIIFHYFWITVIWIHQNCVVSLPVAYLDQCFDMSWYHADIQFNCCLNNCIIPGITFLDLPRLYFSVAFECDVSNYMHVFVGCLKLCARHKIQLDLELFCNILFAEFFLKEAGPFSQVFADLEDMNKAVSDALMESAKVIYIFG